MVSTPFSLSIPQYAVKFNVKFAANYSCSKKAAAPSGWEVPPLLRYAMLFMFSC